MGDLDPVMVPWAYLSSQPIRHLDWFRIFAWLTTVTDRQTTLLCLKQQVAYVHSTAMRPNKNTWSNAAADGRYNRIRHVAPMCKPSNIRLLGPTQVHIPNGIDTVCHNYQNP